MGEVFLHIGTGLKWAGIAATPLLLVPLFTALMPGIFGGLNTALSRMIDRISGAFLTTAMWLGGLMVLSQLAVIIARYVFGLSFSWLNEIVVYSFAGMFLLGAAGTLRDDAHVRVDILRSRFSPQMRGIIELAGVYLFIIPICVRLLTLSISPSFVESWGSLGGSAESDGLPLKFLFRTLVPAFAVLLMLAAVSVAAKAALGLRGLGPHPDASNHGEAG